MEHKTLSLKELEDELKSVEVDEHPKYIGDGLYEIAPNVIGGEKFYKLFINKLKGK